MTFDDLKEVSVTWQGISEYTTQRGRVKPILTGIPGELFWFHRKNRAEFRAKLDAAMISVQKIAKGQWQVVVWINNRNRHLVEALGFSVPEVAKDSPQPF